MSTDLAIIVVSVLAAMFGVLGWLWWDGRRHASREPIVSDG